MNLTQRLGCALTCLLLLTSCEPPQADPKPDASPDLPGDLPGPDMSPSDMPSADLLPLDMSASPAPTWSLSGALRGSSSPIQRGGGFSLSGELRDASPTPSRGGDLQLTLEPVPQTP